MQQLSKRLTAVAALVSSGSPQSETLVTLVKQPSPTTTETTCLALSSTKDFSISLLPTPSLMRMSRRRVLTVSTPFTMRTQFVDRPSFFTCV